MGKAFDVIVVGARCAGSPTAMLLARKGYRVLAGRPRLHSRATPSQRISCIPAPSVRSARWELLDRLVATGCPPIHTYAFDFGAFTIAGAPGTDKDPVAYCPRRTILDKLLVDAAAESGAEIRQGFVVEEIMTEGALVSGIKGRSKQGGAVIESTDHAGPDQGALLGEAAGEVEGPLRRQVGGGRQADGERRGAAAHGVDVGEVLGRGPVADVVGFGPVPAEVPSLDHQVGRDHHVAVADPQHRGIVTRADEDLLALLEERHERLDQCELTDVADRRIGGKRGGRGHGSHPTTIAPVDHLPAPARGTIGWAGTALSDPSS